ncbi:RagB/SusD family nutrient uptake outer membrane protein [Reichenbachiella carrageenanivorans]|uniref:RagB/SusD family nutrient uptake outer membrane protein n=1 Tax=Reichenbachiella carrageenanivorans TaxID=2979869 RepID=A0ABY6D1Q4_9BACT|nr:RagB/SusD family nutrient uptake outer membrane protein [Reichenbachiella carrageenanivorans]UXX79854.1 RagB/SusD family nutrient uptake outer membrane protein [Reichenbachiella carrageenanivorans]
MKVFSKITLLLCLAISVGCQDFLEENPKNLLTVDDIPHTVEGAEKLVFAAYENWTEGTKLYARWMPLWEIGTDNMAPQELYSTVVAPYVTHTLTATEQFMYTGVWGPLWQGVADANNAIDLISAITEISEEEKAPIIGEALFMRALYYYHLVRMWGDQPIFLESVNSLTAIKVAERQSVEEVYEQVIIPDLIEAADLLPGSYTGDDIGRMTKWSAKVVLAEVYLTRAGWRRTSQGQMVQGDAKYYELAQDAAWEVIQNPDGFDIHTSFIGTEPAYARPWLEAFSSESLVEFGNLAGMGIGAEGEGLYLVSEVLMARQNLFWGNSPEVNSSPLSGGKRGFYIPTPDFFRTFEAGDERKEWGLLSKTTMADGSTGYTNPVFRKWADPAIYNGNDGVIDNDGENNIVLYRVADALLIYAEAVNEVNGAPTAQAYAQINRLRNRAGLGDLPLGLDYEGFKKVVWQERRVELHAECKRKFDLIRTNRLLEESNTRDVYYSSSDNPDYLGATVINDILVNAPVTTYPAHEHLWPIPVDEMTLNKSWVQNDGY